MTFRQIIEEEQKQFKEDKNKTIYSQMENSINIPPLKVKSNVKINQTFLIDDEDIEKIKEEDFQKAFSKVNEYHSKRDIYQSKLDEITNKIDDLFEELFNQDQSLKKQKEDIENAFILNKEIDLLRIQTIEDINSEEREDFLNESLKKIPEELHQSIIELFETYKTKKQKDKRAKEIQSLIENYFTNKIDFSCLNESFITHFQEQQIQIKNDIIQYQKEISIILDDIFMLNDKMSFQNSSDEEFLSMTPEEQQRDIEKIEARKELQENLITELFFYNEKLYSFMTLSRIKNILNVIPEEQMKQIQMNSISSDNKNFKIIKYDNQLYMNDKVTNNLTTFINGELFPINPKFKQKEVNEKTVEVLIKNIEEKTSQVITSFDSIVLNKIYTITQEKKYFDINEIKKQMTQEETKNGMKKGKLDDEIKASIEKLSVTKFSLKIAKEINQHFKFKLDDEILEEIGRESYLLPVEKEFYKKGGQMIECYSLIQKPLYFSYATATGQIMTIESSFLRIPELSNTKDTITLKETLAKRIQNIIYNKFDEDKELSKVNYKTLFVKETELLKNIDPKSETYKNKYKRLRKNTQIILNNYKQSKKIKDFKEYKLNGKIEGIQIFIHK